MTGRVRQLLVACVACVVAGFAMAQDPPPERDRVEEEAIVAELEAVAPETVPDFVAATEALDAGEWQAGADAFSRVLERAPTFDAALRRKGLCVFELGNHQEGIDLQRRALAIRRSPENLSTMAYTLTLADQARGTPDETTLRHALELAREATSLEPEDGEAANLLAHLALQVQDESAFRYAVERLLAFHPEHMPTHYYAAILARFDGRWSDAEREIREAGRLGLPQPAVDEFLASGVQTRVAAWGWAKVAAAATGVWAAGLLLLFLVGRVLSGLTLAPMERDDPSQAVSASARRLRAIYRVVVNAGGMYWYVSLPFVALIVLALTGGVIYGFLSIGRVPIKLVLILVAGAVVTLYAIVRSCFVKVRDDEDPGRAVTEADAPGLWEKAREVAEAIGTRPVDEIWLTPGTELAVFERGSMRERIKDRARRALILGAGVLDGFEQHAFCAVLAHEYGHFSHRDTAGGDVALRVRHGMFQFAMALAAAGYAVWWNLAFQFLRLYDFLFRRISHGATRLQEVLADRVAVKNFGLDAFKEGLTHAIRRSIQFENLARHEIEHAIENKREVANLYALKLSEDLEVRDDIERQVREALEAETSDDDTHPSPKDRFRLASRVPQTTAGRGSGMVWDLFLDPEGLMEEMTALIARRVAERAEMATAS